MKRKDATNRSLRVPGYAAGKADSLVRFLNTQRPDGSVEHFRVMEIFGLCRELDKQPARNTVQRKNALLRLINAHLEEFVFAVRLGFSKGDVSSVDYVLHWRQSPYPRASHFISRAACNRKKLGHNIAIYRGH